MCFTGYVDLTPEMDRDMGKLLIGTEDVDANFDDEVGRWALVPFLQCVGPWVLGPRSFRIVCDRSILRLACTDRAFSLKAFVIFLS